MLSNRSSGSQLNRQKIGLGQLIFLIELMLGTSTVIVSVLSDFVHHTLSINPMSRLYIISN